MTDLKYIDIAEFRERGYLQEVNRKFFHPLGLALEVKLGDDGTMVLGGIWDYRDDPEGIRYDPADISAAKVAAVQQEWEEKETSRYAVLGYMVQPGPYPHSDEDIEDALWETE